MSGKTTEALLKNIGVDPRDLDGIFITHEHRDHVCGAGVLSRRYNIPLFANGETWEAMAPIVKKIDGSNIKEFRIEENFYFKDIFIKPVPTFHDAVNPNGYVFETEGSKISIITDTGWINTEMLEQISNSDIYFLESNHDVDMLKNGSYPWPLKQRVLSTKGHLSNDNCSDVIEKLVKGTGEIIVLSHLSVDNNRPEIAYDNMKKTLDKLKIDLNTGGAILEIAPRYTNSKLFDIRRQYENISNK